MLAAVAISDPVLLRNVPELRNPETYGPFAAYIEGLSPAAGEEPLSGEDVTTSREILTQLSEPRDPWDFDGDQKP